MIAIETKYFANSGRVKAFTSNGHSLYWPYRTEQSHAEAACALARKLNWHPDEMVEGDTSRGKVFVFTSGDHFDVATGALIDNRTNGEGLTYLEWIQASGQLASAKMANAWREGEDPTEYRA